MFFFSFYTWLDFCCPPTLLFYFKKKLDSLSKKKKIHESSDDAGDKEIENERETRVNANNAAFKTRKSLGNSYIHRS